ncbi:enoyl-CoA hydratase/isomerase family protein [Glaciecola sp. 1036]|uniref:enoyl-CoA hydratase/isomerase family protein n=1 Tax=Alteromonadaceae TaxID=72275 RepID=UPI003D013111
MQNIEFSIDKKGIAKVILNRPEMHNAFDDVTINELIEAFSSLDQNPDVRVLILSAKGKSFSAGADINWMKRMASYSVEENQSDAMQLSVMLNKLYNLNIPTIARVQGAAFGGAVGLVACCDIAVGSKLSKFCFSEVKLGLIPATISPYVIDAIGAREAKRLFMTAEVISSRRARRLGLLSETVSEDELDSTIDSIITHILKNGPKAVAAAKKLVLDLANSPINEELMSATSQKIADIRVSEEGQQGLSAFLNKSKPSWIGAL